MGTTIRIVRSLNFSSLSSCCQRRGTLPITRQPEALNISRGSVYYLPRPDLAIMRRLVRLHLEFLFAGSRMLRGLAAEGCKIGRRHVTTLMRRMEIEALYRRPRTTKPKPGHMIYPCLLRGMEFTRPNQVWRWLSHTSRWRVGHRAIGASNEILTIHLDRAALAVRRTARDTCK